MKKALITGVAGQDGSYLAEFLLEKNYDVHGLVRRCNNLEYPNLRNVKNKIVLHQSDLTDGNSLRNLISKIKPDEIYNLAAQSHVKVSFDLPELTADIDAVGALRILDAIRSLGLENHTKFYQASTSEMFGIVRSCPQNEMTPFYPGSPYGCAKLYAHWITINYRESYKIFACNGILYNHESPRRGETFVTRKITKALANIVLGQQKILELGNINSLRDWGHAKDYVRAMWMILQNDSPEDFVISTGKQCSIRDFCNYAAKYFNIDLEWHGSGEDETAIDSRTGQTIIRVNPAFYRPVDVVNLLGDSTKANKILGWQPEYSLQELVNEMCCEDYAQISKNLKDIK